MRGKANCCCLARVQLSVLHPGGGRAVRRWLLSPVLKWWPPVSHLEFAIPQAFRCGDCSFLWEWTRSPVCNGTLLRARCNSFKY
jgi:hypothetical protein